MQGKWRVANGQILLLHQDQTHVCQVTWMADNLLVIEPLNGKGRAEYERTDAAEDRFQAVEGEQDREQDER
jgi:hypothetical protein